MRAVPTLEGGQTGVTIFSRPPKKFRKNSFTSLMIKEFFYGIYIYFFFADIQIIIHFMLNKIKEA